MRLVDRLSATNSHMHGRRNAAGAVQVGNNALFNIVTSTYFTISSSFSFGPNTLSSVYVHYFSLYGLYSCVVEAV